MRKTRSVMRTLLLALVLLGAAGLAVNWYAVPVKVRQHTVVARQIPLEITAPGLLDAINKVTITARISGFLSTVAVDKNDTVTEGQVIAQLESQDLRNQLVSAEADEEAAKSAILEAKSERDRAEAALAKAQQDYERRSALLKSNATSLAEFSATEAQLKDAQATYARTGVTIQRSIALAASAKANVEVLKARLAEATIRSPINGVVVSRDRNVGDLLSPGVALMQIVDPASIIVSARLDETNRNVVRAGQRARAWFSANAEEEYTGEIVRLGRQVDPETREFIVDIRLRSLPEDWALSQRLKVFVEGRSTPSAISIPKTMVSRFEGRTGVWKVEDGRAVWEPISLGYSSGADIEVTLGLKAGDVILDPEGRYSYQPVAAGGGEM